VLTLLILPQEFTITNKGALEVEYSVDVMVGGGVMCDAW
jgi:hypothetical protein